jgi:hypothetical protein
MVLSITSFGITTLSITIKIVTLSITAFCIMALNITTKTQHFA